MQLLIAAELIAMVALAFAVSIRNIERELRRKPIRFDDND
jgi:hypothetical protein